MSMQVHIDSESKDISNKKTTTLSGLVNKQFPNSISQALVVGCGNGIEAGTIARKLGCKTIGIDIDQSRFDETEAHPAQLCRMDAEELDFPDNSFDLIYSFHAIEHIPNPVKAMAEMSRVLRPGGVYVLGTPNKSRLLGYFNSGTTLQNKIKWNFMDFGMKVRGKWKNEVGAHAGFTQKELIKLCDDAFGGEPNAISYAYYKELYGGVGVELLEKSGAMRFAYPCVYAAGYKPAG